MEYLARAVMVLVLAIPASVASSSVPDIPDLTGVVLDTVVVRDGGTDALTFTYYVDNSSGSLPIDDLSYRLDSGPSRAVVSIDGLDNSGDVSLISASARERAQPDSFVAVAFPAQGWDVSMTPTLRVRWGADTDAKVVQVGEGVELSLQSRALPGIREAMIGADILDLLPSEAELDALGLDVADMRAEAAASSQTEKVVAPVAPPAQLDLPGFVDEIDALRAEARALGWIQTDAASSSLATALAGIRSALVAEDFGGARAGLEQLLNEVSTLSCQDVSCPDDPPLTSEAFALMHFNTAFLHSSTPVPPNSPPACSDAFATPATLWPPNHKLVSVSFGGVTDPDGDVLTIEVTGVSQDEPVAGSCPDAVIGPSGLELRRDREAEGDGRVYRIDVTGTDPSGDSCSTQLTVCVPHDQGQGTSCVDSGGDHDSTLCP